MTECPPDLDPEVAAVFAETVAALPADHFARADLPLLATYARAVVAERKAAGRSAQNPRHTRVWHDCARLVLALSKRLKI